jgi:Mg-chelatase subunit ChlD
MRALARVALAITLAAIAAWTYSCATAAVADDGRGATGAAGGEDELLYDADASSPSGAAEGAKLYEDRSSTSTATGGRVPTESGLKAGFADDNQQFNYFVKFLADYGHVPHRSVDVSERIVVTIVDASGKTVPDVGVRVSAKGKAVDAGRSYSDGTFNLYPSMYPADSYQVEAIAASGKASAEVKREGPRNVEIVLASPDRLPAKIPVDVLFILDTTGSMGEEIASLRDTIEIINANISTIKPAPALRFGLVLYRDREDEYLTKRVPFTSDLEKFKRELARVEAGGGGDLPEDLESGLRTGIEDMEWSERGLRLAFVITDAPAHVDYQDGYTYIEAGMRARELGIKIYTVGTGGLDLEGEYQLRQISQLTQAKYIFLTYGETGDSAGGATASVSHHVGGNFTSDKLEVVVIRFVKEEFSKYSGQKVESDESYFSADKIDSETREQTLDKLFSEALRNLSDYSSYRVTPETTCAIMPIVPASGSNGLDSTAEYFSTNLTLSAGKAKLFKIVERKDLQKILSEMELQLSGIVDEATAVKVGELIGAEVMIIGELYRVADRFEIYLKLVRVETAEVLAVTKLKISADLGL